jgi:hypothetical protein
MEDEYEWRCSMATPVVPLLPPPRSTRLPIPTTRPPISLLVQAQLLADEVDQLHNYACPASDVVMVEPEGALLPSSTCHSRMAPRQWLYTRFKSRLICLLAGSYRWGLPSIPSGPLDLGTGDLSGSMWSNDFTAYPPAAVPRRNPSRPSISSRPH